MICFCVCVCVRDHYLEVAPERENNERKIEERKQNVQKSIHLSELCDVRVGHTNTRYD